MSQKIRFGYILLSLSLCSKWRRGNVVVKGVILKSIGIAKFSFLSTKAAINLKSAEVLQVRDEYNFHFEFFCM
jgi:hypothetical protein